MESKTYLAHVGEHCFQKTGYEVVKVGKAPSLDGQKMVRVRRLDTGEEMTVVAACLTPKK